MKQYCREIKPFFAALGNVGWMLLGLIERGLPRTPGNWHDRRTRDAPHRWLDAKVTDRL